MAKPLAVAAWALVRLTVEVLDWEALACEALPVCPDTEVEVLVLLDEVAERLPVAVVLLAEVFPLVVLDLVSTWLLPVLAERLVEELAAEELRLFTWVPEVLPDAVELLPDTLPVLELRRVWLLPDWVADEREVLVDEDPAELERLVVPDCEAELERLVLLWDALERLVVPDWLADERLWETEDDEREDDVLVVPDVLLEVELLALRLAWL